MLALDACHMTPDEVDHLMLDAPPGTREKVYGLIVRNGQPSAWVAKERHDRQTRTLIRLKIRQYSKRTDRHINKTLGSNNGYHR